MSDADDASQRSGYSRKEWTSLSIQDRIRAMNDSIPDHHSIPDSHGDDDTQQSIPEEAEEIEQAVPKRSSVIDIWRKRDSGGNAETVASIRVADNKWNSQKKSPQQQAAGEEPVSPTTVPSKRSSVSSFWKQKQQDAGEEQREEEQKRYSPSPAKSESPRGVAHKWNPPPSSSSSPQHVDSPKESTPPQPWMKKKLAPASEHHQAEVEPAVESTQPSWMKTRLAHTTEHPAEVEPPAESTQPAWAKKKLLHGTSHRPEVEPTNSVTPSWVKKAAAEESTGEIPKAAETQSRASTPPWMKKKATGSPSEEAELNDDDSHVSVKPSWMKKKTAVPRDDDSHASTPPSWMKKRATEPTLEPAMPKDDDSHASSQPPWMKKKGATPTSTHQTTLSDDESHASSQPPWMKKRSATPTSSAHHAPSDDDSHASTQPPWMKKKAAASSPGTPGAPKGPFHTPPSPSWMRKKAPQQELPPIQPSPQPSWVRKQAVEEPAQQAEVEEHNVVDDDNDDEASTVSKRSSVADIWNKRLQKQSTPTTSSPQITSWRKTVQQQQQKEDEGELMEDESLENNAERTPVLGDDAMWQKNRDSEVDWPTGDDDDDAVVESSPTTRIKNVQKKKPASPQRTNENSVASMWKKRESESVAKSSPSWKKRSSGLPPKQSSTIPPWVKKKVEEAKAQDDASVASDSVSSWKQRQSPPWAKPKQEDGSKANDDVSVASKDDSVPSWKQRQSPPWVKPQQDEGEKNAPRSSVRDNMWKKLEEATSQLESPGGIKAPSEASSIHSLSSGVKSDNWPKKKKEVERESGPVDLDELDDDETSNEDAPDSPKPGIVSPVEKPSWVIDSTKKKGADVLEKEDPVTPSRQVNGTNKSPPPAVAISRLGASPLCAKIKKPAARQKPQIPPVPSDDPEDEPGRIVSPKRINPPTSWRSPERRKRLQEQRRKMRQANALGSGASITKSETSGTSDTTGSVMEEVEVVAMERSEDPKIQVNTSTKRTDPNRAAAARPINRFQHKKLLEARTEGQPKPTFDAEQDSEYSFFHYKQEAPVDALSPKSAASTASNASALAARASKVLQSRRRVNAKEIKNSDEQAMARDIARRVVSVPNADADELPAEKEHAESGDGGDWEDFDSPQDWGKVNSFASHASVENIDSKPKSILKTRHHSPKVSQPVASPAYIATKTNLTEPEFVQPNQSKSTSEADISFESQNTGSSPVDRGNLTNRYQTSDRFLDAVNNMVVEAKRTFNMGDGDRSKDRRTYSFGSEGTGSSYHPSEGGSLETPSIGLVRSESTDGHSHFSGRTPRSEGLVASGFVVESTNNMRELNSAVQGANIQEMAAETLGDMRNSVSGGFRSVSKSLKLDSVANDIQKYLPGVGSPESDSKQSDIIGIQSIDEMSPRRRSLKLPDPKPETPLAENEVAIEVEYFEEADTPVARKHRSRENTPKKSTAKESTKEPKKSATKESTTESGRSGSRFSFGRSRSSKKSTKKK